MSQHGVVGERSRLCWIFPVGHLFENTEEIMEVNPRVAAQEGAIIDSAARCTAAARSLAMAARRR